MNSKVLARAAFAPEGPWSDPITLYQATPITAGSSIYAAAPQPQYDSTGKTLVVTFTNHPNVIQAIKVVRFAAFRCLLKLDSDVVADVRVVGVHAVQIHQDCLD